MEAGQNKKLGLGAEVIAPISEIGCRGGCGLWRADLLPCARLAIRPEMVA